jgi:NAD(P)-dependent dehydrogenase (short-subunit alcohol dehydrogenase family)
MPELIGGAALVTGGGSGIGRAIATALAAEGTAVGIVDLLPAGAKETVEAIAQNGGKATFVQADVSRWEEVDRAVTAVVSALGPLGVVVNAAGILDGYLPVEETEPALWERVLAINLSGTFFVCRRALPELLAAGQGRIINLASAAGLVGDGGGVAYIVSKHGVVGLTRQMGVKYAARGLTVNAICPGPIGTELRAHSMEILGPGAPQMGSVGLSANPELIKTIVPVGRRGTVEEVAACACFLASQGAAYVTGQTLVVDGGWTAH